MQSGYFKVFGEKFIKRIISQILKIFQQQTPKQNEKTNIFDKKKCTHKMSITQTAGLMKNHYKFAYVDLVDSRAQRHPLKRAS